MAELALFRRRLRRVGGGFLRTGPAACVGADMPSHSDRGAHSRRSTRLAGANT